MDSRLLAVTFDAHDPESLAAYWGHLLDREVVVQPDGALLPGDDTQVGLGFVAAATERSGLNGMHLHLTSATHEEQQQTVERALDLGGRHLDVGQRPEEGHVVLADPDGNEFCVIGPDSTFLAGCGPLGEVACDGSREVGLFWHHALRWPLVWDQGEETAVQAPSGGTKLAWGGPLAAPRPGRDRQRFDLAAADLDAEVARLTALGASRIGRRPRGIVLADPDGRQFWITTD